MNRERDIEAIASYGNREDDPGRLRHPEPQPYRCEHCDWTGRGGAKAYAHAVVQKHRVVGAVIAHVWDYTQGVR